MDNLEINRNKLNKIANLYTTKESHDDIHRSIMLKKKMIWMGTGKYCKHVDLMLSNDSVNNALCWAIDS
jgi:hypothetical protein